MRKKSIDSDLKRIDQLKDEDIDYSNIPPLADEYLKRASVQIPKSSIHTPLHPGEIIKEILLEQSHLTVTEAARRLGVTRPALSRLLNGKANLSPEMAVRLAKLLSTSTEMWLNLQAQYDAWLAHEYFAHLKITPLSQSQTAKT